MDHLNGIYAFAVWEAGRQRLFLARDRMGVKPLFFTQRAGRFLFASEIKTLLAHPAVPAQIDAQGVAELMLIGPGRTPGYGVFRGVEELEPGHCAVYADGRLSVRRYWQVQDAPFADTPAQAIERVRALVTQAVERQLVSDVPLCTFLSGGLDSSLLSALAQAHLQRAGEPPLHTFSVDYRDNARYFQASHFQPNADGVYIEQMTDFLGTVHHNIVLDTPALVDALFEAVQARDLPGMADVDASLLLFCRAVKAHATVALSGECADEVFGGYPWFRDPDIRDADGFPWAQSTPYRATFLTPDFARKIDAEAYVHDRYASALQKADVLPGQSALDTRQKQMMRLNLDGFMQTLLDRKDRMSMYSGLEVRVPFCDAPLVEYLYAMPWHIKEYQGREKGILRKAMQGVLPEGVLWRKKSPYPKTHHPAYRAAVTARMQALLDAGDAPLFAFVDRAALTRLLQDDTAQPFYGQLMTTPQTIAYFLQMDYWLRHYHVQLVG